MNMEKEDEELEEKEEAIANEMAQDELEEELEEYKKRVEALELKIDKLENQNYEDDEDDDDDENTDEYKSTLPLRVFPRLEQPNITLSVDGLAYTFGAYSGKELEILKSNNLIWPPFGERKSLSTEEQLEVKTIIEKLKTIITGKSWETKQ